MAWRIDRILPALLLVGSAIVMQQCAIAPLSPPLLLRASEYQLAFEDQFNGSALDPAKWLPGYWWDRNGSTNLSNHELQWYQADDVLVENGKLRLRAQKRFVAQTWVGASFDYTSGLVSTGPQTWTESPPRFTFHYGYAEIRARVPGGRGLWPAFWLLPVSLDSRPEIDVIEVIGSVPNTAEFHFHWTNADGTDGNAGHAWVGPDFSAGWHTFALDWQPDALVWYVDGVERWRYTDASTIPDEPMYLLLDLAVGGDWPGAPDASTALPSYFDVDYVRVWERVR